MPETIRAPLITGGSGKIAQVAWATVRTGGQGGAGIFLLNGLEEFNIYHPTDGQRDWLIVAFGMLVAAIQWSLETWRGRKLLGASPEPATAPPGVVPPPDPEVNEEPPGGQGGAVALSTALFVACMVGAFLLGYIIRAIGVGT